jgi:predicted 3-demethylubiquinone-9 3-methyltransferase (glyoxalase superfamily)
VANIQKITPFLWFDGRAKEAAEYYTSIFEDSGFISATKLQVGPGAGASIISF